MWLARPEGLQSPWANAPYLARYGRHPGLPADPPDVTAPAALYQVLMTTVGVPFRLWDMLPAPGDLDGGKFACGCCWGRPRLPGEALRLYSLREAAETLGETAPMVGLLRQAFSGGATSATLTETPAPEVEVVMYGYPRVYAMPGPKPPDFTGYAEWWERALTEQTPVRTPLPEHSELTNQVAAQ